MSALSNPLALRYSRQMEKKKNRNAVNLGRLGGLARAKKLSKEERRAIATKASKAAAEKRRKKVDNDSP